MPTDGDRRLTPKLATVPWVSDRHGRYDEEWENEPCNEPRRENDRLRPQWNSSGRRMATVRAVCDLIDLLRSDIHPTPALLDGVRRAFHDLPPGMLPNEDTLRQMVSGEELLDHGRFLARQGKRPATEFEGGPRGSSASIEFLPSRYGLGYGASIHSSPHGDEDGWQDSRYGDLRGVALELSSERLAHSSWLTIVVRHLKAQGVLFVTREQAETYLAIEAPYWVYNSHGSSGYCRLPKGLTIREPSWGEKQWWRMKRPPLPVDRELVRQEALHPLQ